jgi:hypothetical protein
VAFKLDLPKKLRMHHVFYVILLRPYIEGKHPRSPPIPEILEGEFEYTVEKSLSTGLYLMLKRTQLRNSSFAGKAILK